MSSVCRTQTYCHESKPHLRISYSPNSQGGGAWINLRCSLRSIRHNWIDDSFAVYRTNRAISREGLAPSRDGCAKNIFNHAFAATGEPSQAGPRCAAFFFVIGSLYAEPCAERKMYAYIVFTARRGRCAQTRRGLSNAGRS